ncbi:MAG: OmpH family outer membrane protein [Vampirovibrionales bacterium]|nr:OmpH family outer membrane protein [Vampirovibrionales bacterium]
MNRLTRGILSAGLAIVASVTFALNAFAESVGTVDFEKLMASYNKAQAFNDDMKIRERELEKLRAEYAKQLRETKTSQPNNPVALDQLEKDLQGKFAVKMNESRDWMLAKTKEIDTEVNNAISAVASAKKVDLVVTKQAVLHGGTDITNDVLAKLNAGASAK